VLTLDKRLRGAYVDSRGRRLAIISSTRLGLPSEPILISEILRYFVLTMKQLFMVVLLFAGVFADISARAEDRCAADAAMIWILAEGRLHHPHATARSLVDMVLISYRQQNAPSWLKLRLFNLLDFAERNLSNGADGAKTEYLKYCSAVGPMKPVGPN
jgi:hypothetical protein